MHHLLRWPAAVLAAVTIFGASGAGASALIWQSSFQRISEMPGPHETHTLLRLGGSGLPENGYSGEALGIPVPFEFHFLGEGPYSTVNAGAKGYLIPGTVPVGSSAARGDPSYLVLAFPPHNLVAAWWGDHTCFTGHVLTKTLGTAPDRRFVVEWSDCGLMGSGRASFEAQVWLYEGQDMVRVKYGDLERIGTTSWPRVGWGIKGPSGAGSLGPNLEGELESCDPTLQRGTAGACDHTFFPAFSTIQYGRSSAPDLVGRLSPLEMILGAAPANIETELLLLNASSQPIEEIGFDLFLVAAANPIPAEPANLLLYTHPTTESLAPEGSRRLSLQAQPARVPAGTWRLCAHLDPGQAIVDFDRSNDWLCAPQVYTLGPDLTGTIVAPLEGSPGAAVQVPITMRNDGNQDTGPFDYRIRVVGLDGTPRTVYEGSSDGLRQGASDERTVEATLPLNLRGSPFHFELEIDVALATDDVDRSNNLVRSEGQMQNHVANLSFAATPAITLPNGCHFGEPLQATLEICNQGAADALGFYPGLAISTSPGSGIGFDPIVGSSLPFCGEPGSWSYQACAPIQGEPTFCAERYCRLECVEDEDCGAGTRCLDDPALAALHGIESAKSCRNHLGHGVVPAEEKCRTYQIEGKIPFEDLRGDPLRGGAYYFKVVDDLHDVLNQSDPAIVELGPFDCAEALPELEAVELLPLDPLVAGKTLRIQRRLANHGFTTFAEGEFERREKEPFRYRYYLSRTENVSKHQIPLPTVGEPDGYGADALGRGEEVQRVDRVELPSELAPGTYYLGLIIDPDGQIREHDKRNNLLVFSEPLEVQGAALRVLTAQLPRAEVGREFRHSLVASLPGGMVLWSADELPPGLSLTPGGTLTGVPLDEGSFAFRVRASGGGLHAERLLILEVLPPTSSLEIATKQLPLAVRGVPYGRWFNPETETTEEVVRLAAVGGYPPYRWALDPAVAENLLPQGLEGPTEDGLISGTPTRLSQDRTIVVQVRDAKGNTTSGRLDILVLEEGSLVIPPRPLPQAVSGDDYGACVDAQGARGVIEWSVGEDALPSGLVAEPSGGQLCLRGVPNDCGLFTVGVGAKDETGQTASSLLVLEVECGGLQLNARDVVPLSPGMEISFLLRAIPSNDPSFRLIGGALPPGLVLEEDGRLHGTVADDAWVGVHDSIVELRDETGRRGLGALSLTVTVEATERPVVQEERSGCSSAAGGGGGLFVAFAALALSFSRRNSQRRAFSSSSQEPGRPASSDRSRGQRRIPRSSLIAPATLLLGLLGSVGFTAACGSETVTTELSRCLEVECGKNQLCDEADGLCKCGGPGGQICHPDDHCILDPSPQCVGSLCEFVECELGMSCHPELGECLCGIERCDEGERCVQGACTVPDLCEGVVCEGGLSCDPDDGSCSCGGEICEPDAACVDGSCVSDPCLGVSCGVDSVCNPDDGSCHCGSVDGPICTAGEVCDVEGEDASCVNSSFCDGVVCPTGESCDPDDGVCRCGGVGADFPGCSEGESCLEGICHGGDLCAPDGIPTVCAPGLACDPLDGICKCGGKDGTLCGPDESCTSLLGAPTCLRTCSPIAYVSECGPGEGCYLAPDRDYRLAFCTAAGARRLSQTCDGPADCEAGLFCSRAEVCTQLCEVAETPDNCPTVDPLLECSPVRVGSEVGYCRAP